MNLSTIKTPGVYINEINAFPNSVVAVETAVPAFIGYTPYANYDGKSYTNVAMKIDSFATFQAIYCIPDSGATEPSAVQYKPEYYLQKQDSLPTKGNYVAFGSDYYSILPDPSTIYYLYNSIKLFFDNGGGSCYIVSIGGYGPVAGKAMEAPGPIENPNVKLDDLKRGLDLLKNEQEPTMYVCPEATLMSVDNNATFMKAMLGQSSTMQTAISILDVMGGDDPDPLTYMEDITAFRDNTGTEGLDFGCAYYPFVGTTVMQNTDLTYENLFGGDVKQLEPILNPQSNPNPVAAEILNNIENPPANPLTVTQYNSALLMASKEYKSIIQNVLLGANILPPSGGMAGVMARTDENEGVWIAPANTSMNDVVSLPIYLSEDQQGDLNVDAISGKSINAIRSFTGGLGILVWGARTLDGNSLDWKYLNVRRTIIMLEQSCKLAAQAYVFAPNVKNTWESVKSMIGSFLTGIWKQGGLMGASPADAFSVECGLGTTMTADEILLGFMNVTVKVAMVRPAEFIVITFQQQMPQSS
ncbi:MAG: phage tail sheath C-terminal domain-containing protein [Gilvibacter sp.]